MLSRSVVLDSAPPWTIACPSLLCPWYSPGKNTGTGCHTLLQGIFPIQGLNPGLPHCRWILHCLRHQGSSRILEWVAYPFSRASSDPGIETRSPALHTGSLPAELPGKPSRSGRAACFPSAIPILGSQESTASAFPSKPLEAHLKKSAYEGNASGG